jgi:hypothetical protein
MTCIVKCCPSYSCYFDRSLNLLQGERIYMYILGRKAIAVPPILPFKSAPVGVKDFLHLLPNTSQLIHPFSSPLYNDSLYLFIIPLSVLPESPPGQCYVCSHEFYVDTRPYGILPPCAVPPDCKLHSVG